MADYCQALLAVDPNLGQAYLDAAEDAMTDVADADPIVGELVGWLDAAGTPLPGGARERHGPKAHPSVRPRYGGSTAEGGAPLGGP